MNIYQIKKFLKARREKQEKENRNSRRMHSERIEEEASVESSEKVAEEVAEEVARVEPVAEEVVEEVVEEVPVEEVEPTQEEAEGSVEDLEGLKKSELWQLIEEKGLQGNLQYHSTTAKEMRTILEEASPE